MGFWNRLFGKAPQPPEHAVIVRFRYGGSIDLTPLFALEKELDQAITQSRVGEYDGNEVATDGSDGSLYMYGPDGDKLFAAVRPILERTPFMKGATAILRYGPAEDGVRKVRIEL